MTKTTSPASPRNNDARDVSAQEAEAAGVPTTASKQKNLRQFANFEDQLKQIRMSEQYLKENPDIAD